MAHAQFDENPLAYWLSLFPADSRSHPRLMALAEAILRQASDLVTLTQQTVSGFSFATAVGEQLDALGTSVFIPRRNGWDDETYRSILLRKLKRLTWDGSNETLPEYLEAGETYVDGGDNSVTVQVSTTLPLPASELLPIPMGVKVNGGNP